MNAIIKTILNYFKDLFSFPWVFLVLDHVGISFLTWRKNLQLTEAREPAILIQNITQAYIWLSILLIINYSLFFAFKNGYLKPAGLRFLPAAIGFLIQIIFLLNIIWL